MGLIVLEKHVVVDADRACEKTRDTIIFEIMFTSTLLDSFPNPILKHTSLILSTPPRGNLGQIVLYSLVTMRGSLL